MGSWWCEGAGCDPLAPHPTTVEVTAPPPSISSALGLLSGPEGNDTGSASMAGVNNISDFSGSGGANGPWDYDQSFLLFMAVRVTSTMSGVGALFIIVTFLAVKDLRKTFSLSIVFWLACCDFMVSAGYWMSSRRWQSNEMEITPACLAQSIITQFFGVGATMWTICLAHNLYVVVVHCDIKASRFRSYYHVLAWTTAATMTAIPYNSYGPAGAWCWIAGFRSPSRLTYYIPILLAEIYCLYIFFKGKKTMWRREGSLRRSTLSTRERILQQRILLMIAIYVLCTMPGVINRMLEFAAGVQYYPIIAMQSFAAPLIGFCDALVYGNTAKMRDIYRCRRGVGSGSGSGSEEAASAYDPLLGGNGSRAAKPRPPPAGGGGINATGQTAYAAPGTGSDQRYDEAEAGRPAKSTAEAPYYYKSFASVRQQTMREAAGRDGGPR